MEWTEIRKKLKAGDANAVCGLCMWEAPAFTKVGAKEMASFVDRLVAEREAFETVEAWHARVTEVTRGSGVARLIRIVEAVSDVTDDEAFPTEENRHRARQAAALRQRRPDPVPVDPTLQAGMDLPPSPEGIVKAHVRAWLLDRRGRTLPSPVERYVRARQWGEGKYAARVRLFDGAPATIYVEGDPKPSVAPNIRHDGNSFYFHGGEWAWKRALPGQTFEDWCRELGDHSN